MKENKALKRCRQACKSKYSVAAAVFLFSAILVSCAGTGTTTLVDASEASPQIPLPSSTVLTASPSPGLGSKELNAAATPSSATTPEKTDSADADINKPSPESPEPANAPTAAAEYDPAADDFSVPMGEWATILVNPTHLLSENFKVDLSDFEGGQVDCRIREVCTQMFADAEDQGISLILVDAYRTYDRQNELYQKKVRSFVDKGYNRQDAENKAATITARPNTSEHQTGLALDIVTSSYKVRDEGFAKTEAYRWLDENAHKYGFTLRYKKDKESITKVIYEPWHWRFVGVEAAAEMKESGECYEEYLE